MNHLLTLTEEKFKQHFDGCPLTITSPGRINIIGEHIDYHGGHVMPAAIDKGIVMSMARNDSNELNLYSIDYDASRRISLENPKPLGDWSDYITGVVLEMRMRGKEIGGINMAFAGNLPIGSGLSSSAALECGVAIGLNELYDTEFDKRELSLISQSAENNYVGVQCGLMDQYASLFGKEQNILCMDCRTNTHRYLQVELSGYDLVLCNSGVNHSLSSSDYNVRRDESDEGLSIINEYNQPVEFLCEVDINTLTAFRERISPVIYKRCKYAIEENNRVLQACDAIENGDIDLLGQLMYETHHGLSKEYEVSCPELDFLVDATREVDGILGSRMMGGGFGGCTINLVRDSSTDFFNEDLKSDYRSKFGLELSYIHVKLSDGGKIVV